MFDGAGKVLRHWTMAIGNSVEFVVTPVIAYHGQPLITYINFVWGLRG